MSQWKASDYIVDPEVAIGELNLLNKQAMKETLARVYLYKQYMERFYA